MNEDNKCSTCKNLQSRASFCHLNKETIYKIEAKTNCKDYVKSYRTVWESTVSKINRSVNRDRVNVLDWTGVK